MTWENRLTLEVSSADPDADTPVWVDLTLRIRDISQSIEVNIGRQDDLEGSSPTVFTLLLDNSDDALTYGNTTSPYASWWGPGRKGRLRDTVNGMVIDIATGYLQMPTEVLSLVAVEHRVTLSFVDRLGRMASGETFVSTLAAHINFIGGPVLRRYWPCTENGREFFNIKRSDGLAPIRQVFGQASVSFASPVRDGVTSFTPQGASPVGVDDARLPLLAATNAPNGSGNQVAVPNDFRADGSFSTVLGAGKVVTAIGWYYPTLPSAKNAVLLLSISDTLTTATVRTNDFAGTLVLEALGTLTSLINGPVLPDQAWVPIGIRYGWDTATVELWVGRNRYPGVLAGVPGGGPNALGSTTRVCTFYAGGFGHIQHYISDPTEFTFQHFLDQQTAAATCLERQLTGDRIRTMAAYAGLPAVEYTNTVDPGTSPMQLVSLAGRTAVEVMREAEVTEQGLLHTDPSGRVVFRDRRSLYNI